MTNTPQTHVLIAGGGFGGVKAALELCRNDAVHVTLLSDQENFRYYPALYHAATGGRKAQVSIPLGSLIGGRPITFAHGTAQTLDRAAQTLTTREGQTLHYDVLVLALGVVTNYFGIKGLEAYSYGIKSWEQVDRFKHHLHQQITDDRRPDLNYVIVDGGPTGIELAGALPAYLHEVMRRHGVRDRRLHIEIIEAAPRLLPRSAPHVSKAVGKRLQKLGVEVRLGQKVQGETADALMVNGQPIASRTVVWTAGTTNHPFFKANSFTMNERGKVVVDECLRSEPNVYVIGDNAATPFSGLAETAVHDGRFAAADILRRLRGAPPKAYHQKPPIPVIPAGRGWAAVEWRGLSVAGRVGWWLRGAADWVAFKDLEPWWKATEQWMTEFGGEEDCPVCAANGQPS